MHNLSTIQIIQLTLLAIACLMILCSGFRKITRRRFIQKLVLKNIANSANLPNMSMLVDPKYASEQYQALYLIQYKDYDLETIEHQSYGLKNRVYEAQSIKGNQYAIVDINDTELAQGKSLAIEENYTKAIFIIEPSAEYFYLDVLFPSTEHTTRITSRHITDSNNRRISRDELKHCRVIGSVVALVKNY